MYAIYNNKTNIIRTVVSTAEQNLQTILSSDETYQKYPANASVRKGYNIKRFDNQGGLLPLSEQIELGFIELAEDEILENEIIRKLTEIEQIEKGIIPMPENKEIRTDDEGNKYLYTLEDPTTKELQEIETEINSIEDEALKSIIQDRINGII